ncbi:uncharacterized protein H6S33_000390 [Morchella sextelata]|uniref:uncharacterized protein n=1 Tax=Morchella sextelata TaxID=1174677 RepID=UPI001D05A04E|nr:uncharacterized protein H6S33_000390 [Morchella sextelata]KAH0614754.1 hypothetical protein H6S33_000390 [Morchella sextelata]
MHPGNNSNEFSRLSVAMALSYPRIQRDATATTTTSAAGAPVPETDEFTTLLSALSFTHARSTTTTTSETILEASSSPSSVSAPFVKPTEKKPDHHVDRTTTVAHGGRQFNLSPRAPGPALGTRDAPAPRVKVLRKPDSGILLSRSGRLYYDDAAESGAMSVADSMAAGSGSGGSGYAGVEMGRRWCRDVVGREMMGAERCGWRAGMAQGPPAGRGLRSVRGVGI